MHISIILQWTMSEVTNMAFLYDFPKHGHTNPFAPMHLIHMHSNGLNCK
jgi:hypothetical protein